MQQLDVGPGPGAGKEPAFIFVMSPLGHAVWAKGRIGTAMLNFARIPFMFMALRCQGAGS